MDFWKSNYLMPDVMTPKQRHDCMSHIRSKNTKPEQLVRQFLWHCGFRYRLHVKDLPGKPDIVLPKYRTVIFVDGCFWHGHNGCKYYTVPKTNTEFWMTKIARNKNRDQEVRRKLEAKGWSVIIVWECQLKKANLEETIDRVTAEIIRNGVIYRAAQEERKIALEEYRRELKARKEREFSILEEMKSFCQ